MAFGKFFLRDTAGCSQWASCSSIVPTPVANQNGEFDSSCLLAELAI